MVMFITLVVVASWVYIFKMYSFVYISYISIKQFLEKETEQHKIHNFWNPKNITGQDKNQLTGE